MTDEALDAAVLKALADEPLPRSEVIARMDRPCTLPQWYSAVARLESAGALERIGRTKGMRYCLHTHTTRRSQ